MKTQCQMVHITTDSTEVNRTLFLPNRKVYQSKTQMATNCNFFSSLPQIEDCFFPMLNRQESCKLIWDMRGPSGLLPYSSIAIASNNSPPLFPYSQADFSHQNCFQFHSVPEPRLVVCISTLVNKLSLVPPRDIY